MGADPSPGADDEEAALQPEDLDWTRDERVATIDEGRFVVATDSDGTPSADAGDADDDNESKPIDEVEQIRAEGARERLAEHVDRVGADHGFSATAAIEDDVVQHEAFSNDMTQVFEELLTWYARNVDPDTPPEDVLGILLLASGRSVRFPRRALIDVLRANDLGPDDSIADLVDALGEGVRFPPEK